MPTERGERLCSFCHVRARFLVRGRPRRAAGLRDRPASGTRGPRRKAILRPGTISADFDGPSPLLARRYGQEGECDRDRAPASATGDCNRGQTADHADRPDRVLDQEVSGPPRVAVANALSIAVWAVDPFKSAMPNIRAAVTTKKKASMPTIVNALRIRRRSPGAGAHAKVIAENLSRLLDPVWRGK